MSLWHDTLLSTETALQLFPILLCYGQFSKTCLLIIAFLSRG